MYLLCLHATIYSNVAIRHSFFHLPSLPYRMVAGEELAESRVSNAARITHGRRHCCSRRPMLYSGSSPCPPCKPAPCRVCYQKEETGRSRRLSPGP